MFGYEPGELVGRHVTVQNRYPPEESARLVGEVIAQLRARGHWEGEWENVRKDGTPFVTHARITALDLDGTPHWVCVQEDVTERRQAERRQAFLDEASVMLGASVAEERTLAALVRHCVPALADYASIDILTADGEIRRVETAHVDPARERIVRELWARYPFRASEPVGVPLVLRTGEPQFVPEFPDAQMTAFARDDEHLALLRALGPRSYVAVPLAARGRIYGALSLVRADREHGGSGQRYERADLELALELARRAAGAVDNARAYEAERAAREAAETASRRLAVQHAVGAALATAPGFREAIPDVLRALGEQLGWPYAASWCPAGGEDALRMSAVWRARSDDPDGPDDPDGAAAAFEAASRAIAFIRGDGLVGRVWQTGAPAWITGAAGEPGLPRRAEAAAAAGFVSAFAFPIRSAETVFGVIELLRREERTPDPTLRQTMASVGGQIGQFIERKRAERRFREGEAAHHAERERLLAAERRARIGAEAAREQAERAERRVAFLARASAALAATLDVEGTLAAVARLAVPDLADWCFVELLDDAGVPRPSAVQHQDPELVALGWEVMTRYPLRPENRFGSMQVARTGEPALVTDIPDDVWPQVAHDAEHLRVLRAVGFRSTVQVPLRARLGAGRGGTTADERVVGVLTFATTDESGRHYDAADLALAEEVAARAGVALENARLLEAERAARSEAEDARARAEEANRGKSQFLATMSHELRTPLNAIAGHVQLLELGIHGPTTGAQRDALARVGRAQHHLLGLINDVLNYARIESGRVEYDVQPVRVADVVRDVLPMVEPQLVAKGLAFEARLPDGAADPPLLVWADREKLTQILLNLLSNAVKFTPPVGRVTVELSGREAGDGPSELAYLRVGDTGVGIPEDKLEAVFEPFVQVRSDFTRDAGGTGLGLAISRDLARGMGGDLTARSTEGAGSVFTVTLRRVIAADGQLVDRRTHEERRIDEERRRREDRRQDDAAGGRDGDDGTP
jgi:PAS domain S-box-containing protein